MTAAIFCYSRTGCETARRVLSAFTAHDTVCYTLARFAQPGFLPLEKGVYGAEFSRCGALIFIGACGIAVREIAPFVRSKKTDPAVLVIDDRARFVIPILSGHIGGANELAQALAAALHAAAVITTATDAHGKFSVDAWAARNDCAISDMALAKAFSAAILERDLPLMSVFPIASALPGGIFEAASGKLGVYIGCDTKSPFEQTLRLIPKKLRVGVGCRRGICEDAVVSAIRQVFADHALDLRAAAGVYSIDLKKDEPGLLAACRTLRLPAQFYSAQALAAVPGSFSDSGFVASVTGVGCVCERAAMLGAERLLVPKTICGGVTVAVAIEHWEVDFG